MELERSRLATAIDSGYGKKKKKKKTTTTTTTKKKKKKKKKKKMEVSRRVSMSPHLMEASRRI
jgi:hypothetical protein